MSMRGVAAGVMLFVAPLVAVASDWQRIIAITFGAGSRVDSPTPHELAYFTEFPEQRDLEEDACRLCDPKEKAKTIASLKKRMRAGITRVGMVKGFEIFDVFYPHVPNPSPGSLEHWMEPVWKSILVKVGADQYQEIYHYQGIEQESVTPSILMGPVLKTEFHPGSMGMREEEYFWFDESGPTHVEMAPIMEAAQRAMPADVSPYPWKGLVSSYVSPSLILKVPTLSARFSHCCGPGEAEVKVVLRNGKIAVTSARYDPGWQ